MSGREDGGAAERRFKRMVAQRLSPILPRRAERAAPSSTTSANPPPYDEYPNPTCRLGNRWRYEAPERVSTRALRALPVIDPDDDETTLQPRTIDLPALTTSARAALALQAIPSEQEFKERIRVFVEGVGSTPEMYLKEIYELQEWDSQDLPRFLYMWRDLTLREAQTQRAPREESGEVAYDAEWHRRKMEPSLKAMRHIDDIFNMLFDYGKAFRDGPNWIKGSRLDKGVKDWQTQRRVIVNALKRMV